MKIFSWLVRLIDGSTEVREFKQTKSGQFVPHNRTLSAHEVSKPTGKGYDYGKQGSMRRVTEHPKPKNPNRNDY